MVPEIGASGIFTLKPPFNTKLTKDVVYTCIAVREFTDMTAVGADPKALCYTEVTDQTRYEKDVLADVCIVSLQSATGEIVYVPSSFIDSYPRAGGVVYTTLALAISLSALPKSTDLSYLKQQMIALVKDCVGVDSKVKTMLLSSDTVINTVDSERMEKIRQANIAASETDRAVRLRLEEKVRAMEVRTKQLEDFIKTNIK